jgi:hypothetical protein
MRNADFGICRRENGEAVLVAILAFFDDAAVIGVMDFVALERKKEAAENVAIVAGDEGELGEVHGLVVFHFGADSG